MRRAALIAAATVAIVVPGLLLGVQWDNLHNGLLALSFAAVGTFVLARRPQQREALLFLAAGLAQAVMFTGRQVGGAEDSPLGRSATEWLAWLGIWPLPLVLVLVGATIVGSMATVWHGVVNPPRPGRQREWRYDDQALRFGQAGIAADQRGG